MSIYLTLGNERNSYKLVNTQPHYSPYNMCKILAHFCNQKHALNMQSLLVQHSVPSYASASLLANPDNYPQKSLKIKICQLRKSYSTQDSKFVVNITITNHSLTANYKII